jgi:transcriptional regulator with XRE-family HTH domain
MARTNETLGEQFRRRRTRAKLTQVQAAEKAGLQQKTISQIETGAGDPQLSSLRQYAAVLGVELRLVKAPAVGGGRG